MTAGTYNMTIEQGATLSLSMTFKDDEGSVIDLSSYSFASQIREEYDGPLTGMHLYKTHIARHHF